MFRANARRKSLSLLPVFLVVGARQLVTQPSLKAKRPAPVGQRGFWRPLRAAREERAAPRSQTSEGSPRSSSAVSTQTGSPN